MTTATSYFIGQNISIPAGKRITRNGIQTTQKRASSVTIRNLEKARSGKTRLVWKSLGYKTSTLV